VYSCNDDEKLIMFSSETLLIFYGKIVLIIGSLSVI
jgi:hypothetical protein